MAEAVLYSFRRCPYAMRARMALHVSGARYEHREVVLRDKPAAMLAASPKGTVPVFVTEDGAVVDESLAIMRHALRLADPEGWLERDAPDLIAANDGPFKHHLDRYKYATRYEDVDPAEHRSAAVDILGMLEKRLQANAFLCGAERGLADIAIFPFVRQFAHIDLDWWETAAPGPVKTWLAGHKDSARFRAIMAKYPQWAPGAAEPALPVAG